MLVPVRAHTGGTFERFAYGRLRAVPVECLPKVGRLQHMTDGGACERPDFTTHASVRAAERAPWVTAAPAEGWRLWSDERGTYAAVEVPAPPDALRRGVLPVWTGTVWERRTLLVCPIVEGRAVTAYVLDPFPLSGAYDRRHAIRAWMAPQIPAYPAELDATPSAVKAAHRLAHDWPRSGNDTTRSDRVETQARQQDADAVEAWGQSQTWPPAAMLAVYLEHAAEDSRRHAAYRRIWEAPSHGYTEEERLLGM